MEVFDLDLLISYCIYEGSTQRPVHIPYHRDNFKLLEEGLDVFWDEIDHELSYHINNGNWNMVEVYLRSSHFHGIKISINLSMPISIMHRIMMIGTITVIEDVLPYQLNHEIDWMIREALSYNIPVRMIVDNDIYDIKQIEYLRQLGVSVRMINTSWLTPKNVIERLRQLNVQVSFQSLNDLDGKNLYVIMAIEHNLRYSQPLHVIDLNNTLIPEYCNLVKIPYYSSGVVQYALASYNNLMEVYRTLSPSNKQELFRECARTSKTHYVLLMIAPKMYGNHEYEPYEIEYDDLQFISSSSMVTILECIQLTDNEKFEIWLSYITHPERRRALKNDNYIIFFHPSVNRYWEELKKSKRVIYNVTAATRTTLERIERKLDECDEYKYAAPRLRSMVVNGGVKSLNRMNGIHLQVVQDLLSDEEIRKWYKIVACKNHAYQLIHPSLQRLWSVIPTDNCELLWFFYYNRIPLPVPTLKNYCTINPYNLECNPVVTIKRILESSENEIYNIEKVLLWFLNRTGYDPRPLKGRYKILDLIIKRIEECQT
jgi:hypothetical protein